MSGINQSRYSPEVQKACRLSGANKKLNEAKLLSLYESRRYLEQIIKEGQIAVSDHDKWLALEVAARVTLMISDILIVGLETATGPVGSAVSKLYDGSKMIVDAVLSGKIDPNLGWKLLAKNKVKVIELSAKVTGNTKTAKVFELSQQLFSYGEAMWGMVSGASSMQGASGIKSSITTVTNQLYRINTKIRQIEFELSLCEPKDPLLKILEG